MTAYGDVRQIETLHVAARMRCIGGCISLKQRGPFLQVATGKVGDGGVMLKQCSSGTESGPSAGERCCGQSYVDLLECRDSRRGV